MAEADIKALEADFYEKFAQLTAKQQRFFTECVIKGVTQDEAYKLAYDCSAMKPNSIKQVAHREANKVKFRLTKVAFDKWQAADSLRERREVEEALKARATIELDDVAYIDEATGKTKMRTFANMTEKGKKGVKFKISQKYGLVLESDNPVGAAAQLAKMKAGEAPQEVKHTGLVQVDLSDVVVRVVKRSSGEDS